MALGSTFLLLTTQAGTLPLYRVDLAPASKACTGCTSIYTVTSLSPDPVTATHTFFDTGTPTAVYSFTDVLASGAPVPYDLADVSGLPDGFTGTVGINSAQQITATLDPCPWRPSRVHLPLLVRGWENLPAPVTPDDPHYAAYQWNLPQIRAPYAWAVSTGGAEIVIAVVDTGVDLDHPDLATKLVAGYDFANDDDCPDDDHGHGTHVAGIAAAATNNGTGIAGLSWGARIMPLKALSAGSGTVFDTAEAIIYAADHGAQVINLSIGGTEASSTLQDAVDYAHGKGALIVAAAGNCGDQNYAANGCSTMNQPLYPAAGNHTLAVASTGATDERSSFSNVGSYVDVAAPGSYIWSTYPGTYSARSGTSQSAPHVAGLAALVWSRNPTLSNDQVEQVIESTAADLGEIGRDDAYGHGRIDAYRAVSRAPDWTSTHMPEAGTTYGPGAGEAAFESGIVLVKLRPGNEKPDFFRKTWFLAHEQPGFLPTGCISAVGVLRLNVPEGMESEISQRLRQDPAVEYAEPNYVVRAF